MIRTASEQPVLAELGGRRPVTPLWDWVTILVGASVRSLEFLARRPVTAFCGIFLLSVGVRATILFTANPRDIAVLAEAERIAVSVANTGQFANPYILPTGLTAHCPPFYPALLSAVYSLFGTGIVGGYARCMLTIFAYSLLFAIQPYLARRLGVAPLAGVLAGLLSALVPMNRSAEVLLGWEEPYAAIALAYLLWFTLFLWRGDRPTRAWFWYGALWGVALHISPSLVTVGCGVCVIHLMRTPRLHHLRALRRWALALFAAVLLILPWSIRNRAAMGAWIYMRSNLGLEMYLSNNDRAHTSLESNLNSGWIADASPYMNRAAALAIRKQGEASFNHSLSRRAVLWVQDHPTRFLALTIERFLWFWLGPFEHPVFAFLNATVTILGFIGLRIIKTKCNSDMFQLFTISLLTYPLVYYVLQFGVRYRVPVRWIITLSACCCIIEVLSRIHKTGAQLSCRVQLPQPRTPQECSPL